MNVDLSASTDVDASVELERMKMTLMIQEKKLKALQSNDEAVKELKKRNRDLEDELFNANEQINQKDNWNTSLEVQIVELQDELKQNRSLIDQLRSEIKDHMGKNRDMKTE